MVVQVELPGFRRRFRLTPSPHAVQAEVEDDYHCMSVIVHHKDERATRIIASMRRAPWSTCPGAEQQLEQTFTGVELLRFPERGEKRSNCTHLHDLAMLAALHAHDTAQTIYDIRVSDPVDGKRCAEIYRNGEKLLSWVEAGFTVISPDSAAGIRLDKLRSWIDNLAPELQEPARLLQWGNILANGRSIPLENQSDATRMPPNCYSFQPERAAVAKRIGVILDFSQEPRQPLDGFETLV